MRPFNKRELDQKESLCVKMDGQSIMLLNEQGEVERTFSYDYCFWSHDGFLLTPEGYAYPESSASKYADQQRVYDLMGKQILSNTLEGYNCCLFAYGQTGSGKSYSIFGYDANKGIVPIICNELLNGKHLIKDDKRSFNVSISMMEIYNEKIQDLLVQVSRRPKNGLVIRENPKIGVYVEGLCKFQVNSYKEIDDIIATGNKNKTIGTTLMNANSSRAHTIISLEIS